MTNTSHTPGPYPEPPVGGMSEADYREWVARIAANSARQQVRTPGYMDWEQSPHIVKLILQDEAEATRFAARFHSLDEAADSAGDIAGGNVCLQTRAKFGAIERILRARAANAKIGAP